MLYVSEIQKQSGSKMYGITDTDDGATEYYTEEQLRKILSDNPDIKIKGVEKRGIKIVNMGKEVVGGLLEKTKSDISNLVNTWGYQTCEEVARKGSFVRKIKPLADNPVEFRQLTLEHLLPSSIQDVIKQANEYTNQVHDVDITNQDDVTEALRNNMCLILQLGSKGSITAFIGTASLNVVDSIYGVGYFETFYLTKNLYGYTYNIEKMRKPSDKKRPKNPNMHSVISGSLRFRPSGVHHDGADLDLSSPMYTVNLANLVGLFILDNPSAMAKYNVVNEFNNSNNKGVYNFDIQMWNDVMQCCEDATNYFGNSEYFLRYVDNSKLTKGVEYSQAIERFNSDFDYIENMRSRGYSF